VTDTQALFDAIGRGDRKAVIAIVQAAVEAGDDVVALLNGTMIPAMREVGERFSRNEIYVPEMLIAARAMHGGIALIEPLLAGSGHQPIAKVCIGAVKGDLHDIGKNLVVMMLKGAGFEVQDLGVNVDVDGFEAAVARGAQVVCLSALLTTTKDEMRTVIKHFRGRDNVKVVVGGAVVTQAYADEIGAHGYGRDASDAVRAVRHSLGLVA